LLLCSNKISKKTRSVAQNAINLLTMTIIVYYVMRSKNEVLCAAAGRLAAERSEADKLAKAHKTIFAPNKIYYFFFKPS
jgi:predicted PurR-regulated permease PerM